MRRLGDCANFTFGKNLYRVGGNGRHEAEPFGAIGNLRRRLFTRRIEDAPAGERDSRGGLQQERALTDPRFAAEQDDRARHSATTEDAIKLWDAEWEAWRAIGAGRSKWLWLHGGGSGSTTSRTNARGGSISHRLHEGVPGVAAAAGVLERGRLKGAGLTEPDALTLRHAANGASRLRRPAQPAQRRAKLPPLRESSPRSRRRQDPPHTMRRLDLPLGGGARRADLR